MNKKFDARVWAGDISSRNSRVWNFKLKLMGSLTLITKSIFLKTSRILPKMKISGQTGLNMNPLGENRPRSVDLDGSQASTSKTDFILFF